MKRPASDSTSAEHLNTNEPARMPMTNGDGCYGATATEGRAVKNGHLDGPNNINTAAGDVITDGDEVVDGADDDEEWVAILDCGAQYGKVIDRRVRELRVRSEIVPIGISLEQLLKRKPGAIIISGGPSSVYAEDAPEFDRNILLRYNRPILGICYGFQLINKEFGGSVAAKTIREDGQCPVKLDLSCPLFKGLNEQEDVLLTHGDSVQDIAKDFTQIARSSNIVAGVANESRQIYGVQFHPEVDLTTNGRQILQNFLFGIAKLKGRFTMQCRKQSCIEEIQRTIDLKEKSMNGKRLKVLVLVSGGVDSAVCAALLKEAIGAERVIGVHVDNGFMRHRESETVLHSLRDIHVQLKVEWAKHLFRNSCATTSTGDSTPSEEEGSKADENEWRPKPKHTWPLCVTVDPETKRRIIGDTFMKIINDVHLELGLDEEELLLGQGTLRPDLIESASALASGHADAIKTHHNDTALVRVLRERGLVIEPLKDFHKDEVRQLGRQLGLPEQIVNRHPFPGPGLAIRVLCCDRPYMENDFTATQKMARVIVGFAHCVADGNTNQERLSSVRACLSADEQHRLQSLTAKTDIAATLLPIRSVGVQGDRRSYSYCLTLSADGEPTADMWQTLSQLAAIVPRILHNVNRVVYAFGRRIRADVLDVTPTVLADVAVGQARCADRCATRALMAAGEHAKIAQMPVVLVPVHFDRVDVTAPSCCRSVCLRPFVTNDFMTGRAAVPAQHISLEAVEAMRSAIVEGVPMLSRVLYDLTSKPPGTTEWE